MADKIGTPINSGDILTSAQLKNHMRIFAGPGAGKTHFLVENIKNIILTYPPVTQSRTRKILCVTYTNAAVEEIQRRLDRFSSSVEVFTIHSFIIEHIIKPFQKDLRDVIRDDFGIEVSGKKRITSQIEGLGILHGFEKEDVYRYITDITSEFDYPTYSKKDMGDVKVDIMHFFEHRNDVEFKVRFSVPSVKDKKTGIPQLKIEERHILPIKEYVWSVVRKLTHDEILYFGYRILERNSTALYTVRVKFPFIFVDEFQDTNPLQTLLIKLIGEKSTVVGVIGDVAQSIYSFQGARPAQFNGFSTAGNKILIDYEINGNRRSTANIVNFCNFIRKSDTRISQTSIRPYKNDSEKAKIEAKPIHFLIGNNSETKDLIAEVINDGGVVLTRSWSKAFSYIRGIDDTQVKLLSSIYNGYYNTPIDIRAEITDIGNVTWVRAFKFIFSLHKAFTDGSFVDALKAFQLYADVDRCKLNFKLLNHIKTIAGDIFADLSNETSTVSIIETFNAILQEIPHSALREDFFGNDFAVSVFDEYELTSGSKITTYLPQLTWATSYKLFTEVFSPNSRYMTVHQAKGLEWKKVVVAVEPNSRSDRDNIKLPEVYANPQILRETPADEFVRMYYVACSRAMDDLYIHLPDGFDKALIETVLSGRNISYEFV